jgi:hypothetical protein
LFMLSILLSRLCFVFSLHTEETVSKGCRKNVESFNRPAAAVVSRGNGLTV